MTEEEVFDAGDDTQVTKKKKKFVIQREKELEEFKQILSTKPGRDFVWRVLEWCGVYKTSFTGNSTTFFNEGKRQIGLMLLEEVFTADPQAFTRMQLDAAADVKKNRSD
jgi:hypothetical protein